MLRKILGIIWIVIAVALIGVLCAFLFKWKDSGIGSFFRSIKAPVIHVGGNGVKNLSKEQTFGSDIKEIEANILSLDMEIESTAGSTVKLSYYNGAEEYVTADLSSGVLKIKEDKVFRMFAFKVPRIVIEVPTRVLNRINVEKTSGSCSVTGFDVDSVNFKSSSGSISMNDIQGNKCAIQSSSGSTSINSSSFNDIAVKSSSGSIKMEGVKSKTNDISASSGSVKLTDVDFDYLKTHTSSGSVKIEGNIAKTDMSATSGSLRFTDNIALSSESSFEAHSGSIKLYLVPSPEYFFDTKVNSGSVKNDLDSNRMGSVPIQVKATSGSIRIESNN